MLYMFYCISEFMKSWLKKYHVIIIFSIILLYCWFLLFYQLWYQSFWIDEWYSSYVAKYMSINWLYKSSYFIFEWMQALFFKLWWISDFWARFPSVIFQLISIVLMYFIPVKFSKNRYLGLFSSLMFWILYWELGWWRDARFYSLVQCMFLLWIFLIENWIESGNIKYLNFSILLTWVGAIFHPFLYCLWVILVLAFISQYKKLWDRNLLFSKKYLSMRIVVLLWLIVTILCGNLYIPFNGSLTSGLSWNMKKYYFIFYNKHLRSELGVIYVCWILWMLWFIVKRKIKEVIFLLVPFILFLYALIIKGYLMHSRYALLIFPLMIISTSILVFDVFNALKKKYQKSFFLLLVISIILWTAHFQYFPINAYYFDNTSPQPDFKSAYASIPDNSRVISWFPTLCDWYYAYRWTCSNAIRVDLVFDGKTTIQTKKREKYTKIEYIDSLYELKPWIYYFVIDDLTSKSWHINWELYDQIAAYWVENFQSWKWYNSIVVMKVIVE